MPEPIVDVKKPEVKVEEKPVVKEDVKTEAKTDTGEKVGELFDNKKEVPTIRESEFLTLKKENEGLWKEIKNTQKMIADGLTKKEVSDTLKKIGEKYKVDPEFLSEVSQAIKAEADAGIDGKIDAKVKPLAEKEKSEEAQTKAERIDRIFKENFDKTIAAMPDFKDVAEPDVIKSLTLDPANRDKTFAQIIEKAYGHLVKGKGKTLDTNTPGGNKEPAAIDYDKASKDGEYFKTIMADPAQRKEYNANLHKRLKL